MKFSKKNLKYEISKCANLLDCEPNTTIYLSAYTVLKKSYQIATCKHLVANLFW